MNSELLQAYRMHKQNLVTQSDEPGYESMLQKHIGLHSTEYQTPYLSLISRLKSFEPQSLFDHISRCENAIRLKAFRGTVFAIHRKRAAQVIAGAQYFFAHFLKDFIAYGENQGVDFSTSLEIVRKELEESALSAAELKKRLAGQLEKEHVPLTIRILDLKGEILRTGQRYISSRDVKYMLTDESILQAAAEYENPETAISELMFDYIDLFGPVSLEDICWWFPLKKTFARNILERINDDIVRINIDSRELYMTASDREAFSSYTAVDNSDSVVFLPYEDHFPKAYKEREWFIDEETLPIVYHVGRVDFGQLRPTIWTGNRIAGRWEMEWADKKKSAMNVVIHGLSKPGKKHKKNIEKFRKSLESEINSNLANLLRPPKK